MAKDPAFLFYSKDWIEGTMEMTPEEKGIYIDLLCHQHQKGSLPSDTKRLCKLVGLSEDYFLTIWEGIKQKFKSSVDDRLVNHKLNHVVNERSESARKKRIIGIFATIVRTNSAPGELKNQAKQGFKVDDFIPLDDQIITERITEWFTKRLASLGNGNAIGNEDVDAIENKNKIVGGVGEERFLIPQMCQLWYESFPKYTKDQKADFAGMGNILWFIAKQHHLKKVEDTDTQVKILNTLQLIADQVNREPFWLNKPIKSIANNIQEFYNKIKNPQQQNGNPKTNSGGSKLSTDKLKEIHAKHYGGGK